MSETTQNNIVTCHSFYDVTRFHLNSVKDVHDKDCLAIMMPTSHNSRIRLTLNTNNLAYIIYGFECICKKANQELEECGYDGDTFSDCSESDGYPQTASHSEFFNITKVKFRAVSVDMGVDQILRFRIEDKNGVETEVAIYTRGIHQLLRCIDNVCRLAREKMADNFNEQAALPETIASEEDEWIVYPSDHERALNTVTFTKHHLIFPEKLTNKLGLNDWGRAELSYNENTHQIRLKCDSKGYWISRVSDSLYIFASNFKEYFGIGEVTQHYTAHKIDDDIILTPIKEISEKLNMEEFDG